MKIKITTSFVERFMAPFYQNDVLDVPEKTAREWIAANRAIAVPTKQPEFAVKSQHSRRTHKS